MKRILGIEGGGTKTEWLYQEEPDLPLRSGVLPGANLRLISDEALERLLRVLPPEARRVGIYLAGCATAADRARLTACAREVWPDAELFIGGDRESGFAAALHDGDGVVVIAGTGSAITGRSGMREERAGGWGQLLGDTGSGYYLSVLGLRRVLEEFDITRRTGQTAQALLFALGLNRLEELVSWAEQADKMSVAQLAPVIFKAAAEGDEEMQSIIARGASALADGAVAVADRLELAAPEIRLQGGIFTHFPIYVQLFKERVAARLSGANVEVSEVPGAAGALWLAGSGRLPEQAAAAPEIDEGELKVAATEQVNERSSGLDQMSTQEMVDLFVAEEAFVQEALRGSRERIAAAIDLTAEAMLGGGRLFYVGAGTSGRLGVLDASEIPPTFGMGPERVQALIAGGAPALYRAAEGAEDQREGGALAIQERGVAAGDVVCGITASGRTPFVLGALEQARERGAATILLTCNPSRRPTAPGAPWDVEIDLATGPELLTGSTRLKAGTATKCTLNLLSTAAMVRLGRVHDNLMAGVLVSNAKLRDRAIRLVAALRSLSRSDAELELERHGWNVRAVLQGSTEGKR